MTEETIEKELFETLGYVSMCWSEEPKGVFESDKATQAGKDLTKKLLEQHDSEMVAFVEWVNEKYTLFMEYPKQTYVSRIESNKNPFGANLLPRFTITKLLELYKTRKVERRSCEQHEYEYYGFPISSKICRVCGYEKM